MKMKRLLSAILLLSMMVTLVACSNGSELQKNLSKEGIAPYDLSDSEKNMLQLFNMEDTSQIISFHAPKEAVTLNVNVYRLEEGATWRCIGGGGISVGTERQPIDQLTGTFTMQLKENYTIEFAINAGGNASYKTNDILLDNEETASIIKFLQEFQNITLNTEIPVALMVYHNGTSIRSYSLQDYFEPSKFDGMDLVQVVTLEFLDNCW